MRPFLDDDFLLESAPARQLYHDYAVHMPIIDYHCHLSPDEIARDATYPTITSIWLDGDHYKWRAMRINGISERYCTGDASDWEKFAAWAATVPHTMMNPLYHWTHLELRRIFGINSLLSPDTARSIYDRCNARLREPGFSARGLLDRFRVVALCTTDDPADSLAAHDQIRRDDWPVVVLPGFRADKALAVDRPGYASYVERLGDSAALTINSPDMLLAALQQRHDHFDRCGCVTSDHGEAQVSVESYTQQNIARILDAALQGLPLTDRDIRQFKSWGLYELAKMDHASGWVQQFHLSALRNANTRAYRTLGPDAGFDSIGEHRMAQPLAAFLDRLDEEGRLASTILYSVNPAHNEVLASMVGNFSTGPPPGKIQAGTAWWFMDTKDGMIRQMTALANMGLLSRFVGMLTDSRSFLSYPRHEYFRRILCNMIGDQVARGELPSEMAWLGHMVERISYGNARDYFGLPVYAPIAPADGQASDAPA